MCVHSVSQAEVAAAESVLSWLRDDRFSKGQALESKDMTINLPLFKVSLKAKSKVKE